MSQSNGVIKIGRKGLKKFAFGEGSEFEVDVVAAFQEWIGIDDTFRVDNESARRTIPTESMPEFHKAAIDFVERLIGNSNTDPMIQTDDGRSKITTAEALEFLARLREEYDALADFFVPKSRKERDSPDTSGAELRFSVEES